MAEKKSKSLIFIIILLIIAIIIIAYLAYMLVQSKTEISKLNTEISNLKNNSKEEKVQIENWNYDISTIDFSNLKGEDYAYECLSFLSNINDGAFIPCIKGKVSIAVSNDIKNYIPGATVKGLGFEGISEYDDYSERVDLKNVPETVKMAYISEFGQGFSSEYPVFFLMEDGTLKYDSFENVIKNEVDLKTVSGIKNIVELYSCSVCDIDNETGERMGGYVTTVAVDNHGVALDLNKLSEFKKF